ncbi:O-linked N-acetylglucosamine transferase, SPINDLY family protein [Marinobacterium weihaiense]|uniref:Glycosyltransferase n=1 Tax=Marinobacterium weihaiense TaxID=2851016 RepID=A0ABS6MCN7_9GAMM|nr:CDC27 family protein [Marinobacterium weihaiense]MBV0934049.1 glycosyltransferase [Marinobacterium weihaiense]
MSKRRAQPKQPKRTSPQKASSMTVATARQQLAMGNDTLSAYKYLLRYALDTKDMTAAKQLFDNNSLTLLRERDTALDLLHAEFFLLSGRHQDALLEANKVLAVKEDSDQAFYFASHAHYEQKQLNSALEQIDKALALAPNDQFYLFHKATILTELYRHPEAIPIYERLLKAFPTNDNILNNAGNLYRDLSDLKRAQSLYQKAIPIAGRNTLPYSNYLSILHYDPDATAEQIHQVCLEWERRFPLNKPAIRAVASDTTPDKVLRIGMVSGGFNGHPVGRMITRALEHLPAYAFEFYFYSSNGKVDGINKRFQALGHYELVNHLSDEALDAKIRQDKIDILIDLAGHFSGSRMRVMALEPAPVLVKWVGGLINTTGLSSIDYLVSDWIETPAGVDHLYTEKLMRLPGDYICYEMPDYIPPVKSLPAQRNGYITLGCFNNPTKVNDVVLEHWANILHALPGSHLYLKGHFYVSEELQQRIRAKLEQLGISAERVRIEGPSVHRELLDCYNEVDIALDPWPYSGGLTTCEAFAMGVPVVTMPGPTFAGRHSATHLVNAGMPELVTHSWEEYHARVLELAADLDSLATIRTHLRAVLLQSPVCDADTFAGHLNNALRAIWQRYCEGKQPEALSFNEQGEVVFADEAEPVPLLHPEAPPEAEDQQTFKWEFEGKVIAIDHGGQLMNVPVIKQMLEAGTLELIAFDPASHHLKHLLRHADGMHYYPNVLLGDGKPATLYACQSGNLSGTLKPLPAHDHLPEPIRHELKVLAELPINTLALDTVSELPRIDWLVLDDLNNSLDVLEQGSNALKNALLLHADIAFQPTHHRQPNLTEISHWAARHGFRFYCFSDDERRTHVPQTIIGANRYANELFSATALFIPAHERLKAMSDNDRRKLAFIADTAYGLEGLAYEVLGYNDPVTDEGSTGEASQYIDYKVHKQIADKQPRKPSGIRRPPRLIANSSTHTSAAGPVAKPHLTLPAAVAEHLKEVYAGAHTILEYGSGGSTIVASEMKGKRIFTVENDLDWADKMRRYIAQEPHPSPAIIHSVNTGPTAAWARPVDDSGWRNFHAYPLSVWDRDDFIEPDVVLIDGRFRIACFVATFMKIKKPTIVLFDDYADRDYYHVVERLAKPVKIIGRMAHFELVPTEIPREQLTWMIDSFNHVTYADNMRR